MDDQTNVNPVQIVLSEKIEPLIFEMIIKYLRAYNQHLKHTHNIYFIEKRKNVTLNAEGYLISYEVKFLGLVPLVWIHARKTYLYRTILPYPIGRLKNNEYSFNLSKPCSHNFEWKPDTRLNIKKAKSPILWLYHIINSGQYEGLMCNKNQIKEVYMKYVEWCENKDLGVYVQMNWTIKINKLNKDGKIMVNKFKKVKIKMNYGKYKRKTIRVVDSIEKKIVIPLFEKIYKKCVWN